MHKSLICDECGTYVEMLYARSRVKCSGCGKIFSHSGKEKGEKISDLPVGQAGIRLINIEGVGIGVEAVRSFVKGELIERCPVFRVSDGFRAILVNAPCEVTGYRTGGDVKFARMLLPDPTSDEESVIKAKKPKYLIALGFGMLYNHSDVRPNARIRPHTGAEDGRMYIDFVAYLNIDAGEQILVNYHNMTLPFEANTKNKSKWFSSVDLDKKESGG